MSWRAHASAWVGGLVLLLVWAGGAEAQLPVVRIDGVAAVVGAAGGSRADVILRSDVELRARIELAGRTEGELPLGPLPEGLLAATLREMVGEFLIAREAERIAVAQPSEADIAQEQQRLAEAAGGAGRLSALLQALSAKPAEIEQNARRRALVAAFLRANLEGTMVVTDAEVERAYEEAGDELAGIEPEVARAVLRSRLARRALDRAIARWVSVLEARSRVRIHARYGEN